MAWRTSLLNRNQTASIWSSDWVNKETETSKRSRYVLRSYQTVPWAGDIRDLHCCLVLYGRLMIIVHETWISVFSGVDGWDDDGRREHRVPVDCSAWPVDTYADSVRGFPVVHAGLHASARHRQQQMVDRQTRHSNVSKRCKVCMHYWRWSWWQQMDLLMMTALQKLERTARSQGRRRSMARGGEKFNLLHE